jgi:hypothetical protein
MDADLREELRTQLAVAGLTLDEARLEALLPVYTGVRENVRRIAALDLGETEPAVSFRQPSPAAGSEEATR